MKTVNLSTILKLETDRLNLPRFEVADIAPETLADVVSHFKDTGKLKIWAGASELTIWGAPEHNWLFRAWHDFGHILSLGQFNAAGESQVCKLQQSQVASTSLQRALQVEIMGQLQYQTNIGHFPVNQVEFFINQVKGV